MVLRFQTIDLPFGGGVDSKTHDHLLSGPKVAAVENMRFAKSGAYIRRDDYVLQAGAPDGIEHISEHGGALLALTRDGAWRQSADDHWHELKTKGPRSVGVSRRGIVRSQFGADAVFSAALGGYVCHVWTREETADDDVWVRIDDEAGVTIYGPKVIDGLNGSGPYTQTGLDVVAIDNGFASPMFNVFARDMVSNYVASVSIQVLAGSAIEGAPVVYTSLDAAYCHVDCITGGTDIYLLTDNEPAGMHELVRLQKGGGSTLVVESRARISGLSPADGKARGIILNPVGTWLQVYGQGSGSPRELIAAQIPYGVPLPGIGSPYTAGVVYTPNAAPDYHVELILTVVGVARADGTAVIFIDGDVNYLGGTNAPGVKWLELSGAGGVVGAEEREIWNIQIQARPWVDAHSGHAVIPLVSAGHRNTGVAQGVPPMMGDYQTFGPRQVMHLCELEDASATRLRRISEGLHDVARRHGAHARAGTSTLSYARVPHADALSDGRVVHAAMTDELRESTRDSDNNAGSLVAWDLDTHHVAEANVNGVLMLSGGVLAQADSERHAEVMQLPQPVYVEAGSILSGESAVPTSSYTNIVHWRFCWAWRDQFGVVHRSSPSDIVEYTTEVTDGVTFFRPYPAVRFAAVPFSDAMADAGVLPTDLTLEAYASPANGGFGVVPDGVFVRTQIIASTVAPVSFSGSRSQIRYDDIVDPIRPWRTIQLSAQGVTSADIPLYTNGGVLPHDPMPNPLHLAASRDRLWIIDSEDRYRALHTAPIRVGDAPAFSQEYSVRVPTDAGELVALGVIGDSLVLFSEQSMHMLETIGGPNSQNAGAFPPVREISREVGCVSAASIVSTDVGLFFQGRGGIFLVDPAGGLTHVGRDVQPLVVDKTPVGASVLPRERQVIFDYSDGTSLVFDYEHAAWSRYSTTQTGIESSTALYGGHVKAGGLTVLKMDASVSDEKVPHSIITGWIHLAGLQGFKRVKRIGILGRITTPPLNPADLGRDLGTLTMTVAYNNDISDVDVYSVEIAELEAGGQIDPMHLRFHIARQKCQSIKIGIAYAPASSAGENNITDYQCRMELSGLALEVGSLRGIRKIGHAGGVNVT